MITTLQQLCCEGLVWKVSEVGKSHVQVSVCSFLGLPGWRSGNESACQCRRHGFHPWVRKILWRRKWQLTPVFLPGKSHGQRSLEGCSPWDHKESDTTECLNTIINTTLFPTMAAHSSILAWKIPWTEEPGRLQSMGFAKSRTQLSNFTFVPHSGLTVREKSLHPSILMEKTPWLGQLSLPPSLTQPLGQWGGFSGWEGYWTCSTLPGFGGLRSQHSAGSKRHPPHLSNSSAPTSSSTHGCGPL